MLGLVSSKLINSRQLLAYYVKKSKSRLIVLVLSDDNFWKRNKLRQYRRSAVLTSGSYTSMSLAAVSTKKYFHDIIDTGFG